jgi:hypothetical protein
VWVTNPLLVKEINEQCDEVTRKKYTKLFKKESAQMAWLREHLEQVRMSKHPFFIFSDTDPRDLPAVLLKRLTRGRALCLMSVSKDATSFDAEVSYTCNDEATDNDDAWIRSDNSEEDDRDSFTMKMQGTQENGLVRWITINEAPGKWDIEFQPVELPPSID